MEPVAIPFPKLQFVGHHIKPYFIPPLQEPLQSDGQILLPCNSRSSGKSLHLRIHITKRSPHPHFILAVSIMPHRAHHRLLFRDSRLETLLGQWSQQRRQVIPPAPMLQRVERSSQSRLKHHRQRVVRLVRQLHPIHRIFLRPFPFAKRSPVGHRGRLFQTESSRFGPEIRRSVRRHPETLVQCRFFHGNGIREKWLVALHRHLVSPRMKQRRLLLRFRQRSVGQGKPYPNFRAPSAGTHHSRQCLRKQSRLRLDILRFGRSRKTVHFNQYNSLILFEHPSPVRVQPEFRYRIHPWNFPQMDVAGRGAL